MKNTSLRDFYVEKNLLADISVGGRREENAIGQIYNRYLCPVLKMIIQRGGNEADGEDVFQEAVIILYEKIKSGEFELKSRLVSYLLTVSTHIWSKRMRKLGKETFPNNWDEDIPAPTVADSLTHILSEENETILFRMMNHLKEDCREILMSAVFENQSMKVISSRMGYQSAQVARNKKCRCLSYLRKIFRNGV